MAKLSDVVDAGVQAREDLAANLRRVISDAEDLLSATAGETSGKLSELRERTSENLARARERLADVDSAVRDGARRAANATDDYVHDNPWSSIGAAAAIGMLIGVLLGRR
ncbi:MAG: DUF883 domain-containing protein [Burkholderiaceae bacterium]|jgi:ElaB/YqjD/DUF883 family membrane-anchored ribosome-binding protein|nr:MAG: DUF883 domain-containing protein [Burkholderiaceae bacterium]